MPLSGSGAEPTAWLPSDQFRLPDRLEIGCHFEFAVPAPVHTVVIVEPHKREADRLLAEDFTVSGGAPSTTYLDLFGNRCRRLTLEAGRATFTYRATVRNNAGFDPVGHDVVEVPPAELPDEALMFLLPSR